MLTFIMGALDKVRAHARKKQGIYIHGLIIYADPFFVCSTLVSI